MKLLVFNSLKASFFLLVPQLEVLLLQQDVSFSCWRLRWRSDCRGGTSICMSVLALEEELLVERPNPECMSLSLNLFNNLHKVNKQQNSWNILGNKMSVVSRLEVSRPRVSCSRVSHSWLPNRFFNQDFCITFTLIFFISLLILTALPLLTSLTFLQIFDSTFTLTLSQLS